MDKAAMAAEAERQVDAGVPPRGRPWRRWVSIFAVVFVIYFSIAYVVAPSLWIRYARRHPSLDQNPRITRTGDDHPGDPLNVAVIGTEQELTNVMERANWHRAAALGLRSDVKIAVDTVLSRPDENAPVSNLYLFGRKEDLAFEQPVGGSPRQRHHVRFWKTADNEDGRPIWIGAATFDQSVGFSHTTGQITHHIASDVDTERDHVLNSMEQTGLLSEAYQMKDFHEAREGRNGGGDLWRTDGALAVGVIRIE